MNEIEIIKSITFYGFAMLILIFALLSVIANRIIYSLLAAVVVFFCAGGIFFSLGADYNAVVQIAVYGVAVPIIFLFSIMFTSNREDRRTYLTFGPRFFIGFCSAAFLFMFLWYSVEFALHLNSKTIQLFTPLKQEFGSVDQIVLIANGLYQNYQAPFILFGVMILITVVGISVLNVIKEKKRG